MAMLGAETMLLEVKRRVWVLDLSRRSSFQDWTWGVMKGEGSRRMELVVLQMRNAGAGACLEEDREYSLDL